MRRRTEWRVENDGVSVPKRVELMNLSQLCWLGFERQKSDHCEHFSLNLTMGFFLSMCLMCEAVLVLLPF